MMMTITRTFQFEAAHRLPHVPEDHKCARLHGHSFRVSITVAGPLDPRMGWVVDFADLGRAWEPLHAALDHRYLNEVEGLENPTSEVLALWIHERFKVEGARVREISVNETCSAGVTFRPDE